MSTRLPGTDLDLFPLVLGGNVFGWSADEATSFAVLDAFAGAAHQFEIELLALPHRFPAELDRAVAKISPTLCDRLRFRSILTEQD